MRACVRACVARARACVVKFVYFYLSAVFCLMITRHSLCFSVYWLVICLCDWCASLSVGVLVRISSAALVFVLDARTALSIPLVLFFDDLH